MSLSKMKDGSMLRAKDMLGVDWEYRLDRDKAIQFARDRGMDLTTQNLPRAFRYAIRDALRDVENKLSGSYLSIIDFVQHPQEKDRAWAEVAKRILADFDGLLRQRTTDPDSAARSPSRGDQRGRPGSRTSGGEPRYRSPKSEDRHPLPSPSTERGRTKVRTTCQVRYVSPKDLEETKKAVPGNNSGTKGAVKKGVRIASPVIPRSKVAFLVGADGAKESSRRVTTPFQSAAGSDSESDSDSDAYSDYDDIPECNAECSSPDEASLPDLRKPRRCPPQKRDVEEEAQIAKNRPEKIAFFKKHKFKPEKRIDIPSRSSSGTSHTSLSDSISVAGSEYSVLSVISDNMSDANSLLEELMADGYDDIWMEKKIYDSMYYERVPKRYRPKNRLRAQVATPEVEMPLASYSSLGCRHEPDEEGMPDDISVASMPSFKLGTAPRSKHRRPRYATPLQENIAYTYPINGPVPPYLENVKNLFKLRYVNPEWIHLDRCYSDADSNATVEKIDLDNLSEFEAQEPNVYDPSQSRRVVSTRAASLQKARQLYQVPPGDDGSSRAGSRASSALSTKALASDGSDEYRAAEAILLQRDMDAKGDQGQQDLTQVNKKLDTHRPAGNKKRVRPGAANPAEKSDYITRNELNFSRKFSDSDFRQMENLQRAERKEERYENEVAVHLSDASVGLNVPRVSLEEKVEWLTPESLQPVVPSAPKSGKASAASKARERRYKGKNGKDSSKGSDPIPLVKQPSSVSTSSIPNRKQLDLIPSLEVYGSKIGLSDHKTDVARRGSSNIVWPPCGECVNTGITDVYVECAELRKNGNVSKRISNIEHKVQQQSAESVKAPRLLNRRQNLPQRLIRQSTKSASISNTHYLAGSLKPWR